MLPEVREWWALLRCKERDTIGLADALTHVRIDAWAPIEVVKVRLPRSRAYTTVARALLPGWVFVPFDDAPRLMHMHSPLIPSFTVFVVDGIIARIERAEIMGLDAAAVNRLDDVRAPVPIAAHVRVVGRHSTQHIVQLRSNVR